VGAGSDRQNAALSETHFPCCLVQTTLTPAGRRWNTSPPCCQTATASPKRKTTFCESKDYIALEGAAMKKTTVKSPLLLFRDKNRGKLIVADGYHCLCAVYTFDEDAMIPCKIA